MIHRYSHVICKQKYTFTSGIAPDIKEFVAYILICDSTLQSSCISMFFVLFLFLVIIKMVRNARIRTRREEGDFFMFYLLLSNNSRYISCPKAFYVTVDGELNNWPYSENK